MLSWQLERSPSTSLLMRLAHTPSAWARQWQCSLVDVPCSSSWWLVAGQAMPFCTTLENKLKNSTTTSPAKMINRMFHRHIPNYTSPTASHLDPRQCTHPDNVETQRNVGGAWLDKPGCLPLPSLIEHYDQTFRKISFTLSPANSPSHTQILGSTKMEEASLLVLAELGTWGFESLLEHDSKAQPPLWILWYPLHTTSYKDGGKTM